jgi:hypothetical protein
MDMHTDFGKVMRTDRQTDALTTVYYYM